MKAKAIDRNILKVQNYLGEADKQISELGQVRKKAAVTFLGGSSLYLYFLYVN